MAPICGLLGHQNRHLDRLEHLIKRLNLAGPARRGPKCGAGAEAEQGFRGRDEAPGRVLPPLAVPPPALGRAAMPGTRRVERVAKPVRHQPVARLQRLSGCKRAPLLAERFGESGQVEQLAERAQPTAADEFLPTPQDGRRFGQRERPSLRRVGHGSAPGNLGGEGHETFGGGGHEREALPAPLCRVVQQSGRLVGRRVHGHDAILGHGRKTTPPPCGVRPPPSIHRTLPVRRLPDEDLHLHSGLRDACEETLRDAR